MGFIKGKVKDFYLLTTDVENIFINEYLPAAPGDYVKVYLYGLLYAQTGADMDARTFAQQLRLAGRNDPAGMGILGEHGRCQTRERQKRRRRYGCACGRYAGGH